MGCEQCSPFQVIVIFVVCRCLVQVAAFPVNNNDTDRATTKLLAIVESLLQRQADTNVLDYVLETNRGLGLNLYQGDIQGFNARHRTAIRGSSSLWSARRVPYVIHPSIEPDVRTNILEAIEEYHNQTCIRWVPRSDERDYVVFKKLTGCYSMVGKASAGPQDLSLMSPCAKKGTVMHEMLHALGFFHEHSRPDRDDWVEIFLQNVIAGKESDFDRLPVDIVNTLGVQYDYQSIMHYSRTAFSYNGQPTILPKRDPFVILGQREGFSSRDAEKVRRLYHCEIPNPISQTTPPSGSSQLVIGWTPWSEWSECDMQCSHFRYRYCLNPDSDNCPGSSQETRTCVSPCQVAVSLGCWANEPSSSAIPSVEGLYDQVADNYHSRTAALRRCADVATALGNVVFAIEDGGRCLTGPRAHDTYHIYGPSTSCATNGKGATTAINVYSFNTDVDGGWGLWTEWGLCTRSCGNGRKYRYRKCDSPPPSGDGTQCQGQDHESANCNIQDCQEASNCGIRNHVGSPGTSGDIRVLNYDNYMECDYLIESGQMNATISLAVTQMDIELSTGCIYDALTVYDGPDDTVGQFLAAFCGQSPQPPLESSGPTLFLKFISDSTTTGAGFTLKFSINSDVRKACVRPAAPLGGTVAGGNFVGDTVVFSCDPGSHLSGQSSISCVDQPGMAVWTDVFPLCLQNRRRRGLAGTAPCNCSFEGNLCGFRHETNARWRWVVTKGNNSAAFYFQHPREDRYGSKEGSYLYVESTPAWHPFDSARLTSQRYLPHGNCLTFWYRFYGNELVFLHLLQHGDKGETILWLAEGNLSGQWQEIKVQLQLEEYLQISFETFLGQTLASSVAVDDVSVISSCI